MWRQPRDLYSSECLFQKLKAYGGFIMVWGMLFWHHLDPLIPSEGRVDAACYITVFNDHLHPMMQNFFRAGRGVLLAPDKAVSAFIKLT